MLILVYITCKDREEAKKISLHLLEKKLASCVNFLPIESNYLWKGKIVEDSEYLVLAKTLPEKFKNLKEEVKKIHSYEIPCIESIEIKESDKEYSQWVEDELK